MESFQFTIECGSVRHFREMIRQQLLGDRELLRDIVAGREDPRLEVQTAGRLAFVMGLAEGVRLDEMDLVAPKVAT